MKLLLLSSLLVVAGAAQAVQTCATDSTVATSATDKFLVDTATGIATDQSTGLSWLVCSAGSTWNATSETCTGSALQYNWQDALAYGADYEYQSFTDWRLPNVKELMSIIERQCASPAINTAVFVDALSERYWTSTPSIQSTDDSNETAWGVTFIEGTNTITNKSSVSFVRLVRKSS